MQNKICRDCGLDLPLDKFSRGGRKDGYRRPECRSCQHIRSKKINPNYQYTTGAVAARDAHSLSATEVEKIKKTKLAEQGYRCVYCRTEILTSSSDLDHIIPLSRRGNNNPSNFQALCKKCNKEKHSKTDEEYRAWLKQVK